MPQLTKLFAQIGVDANALDGDLSNVEGKFGRLGGGMASAIKAGAAAAGAALAAVAVASTKLVVDFEGTMTRINTLVGISADQVEQWGQALGNIGPEVGRGPRELADALFVVSSAGQRGAAALEIVEQAAKASALGLGETKEVARAVTAVVNAYGAEVTNAGQATDILTAIVREGNLEASELAPTLGRIVGIAAQMGVGFEELGASIATFTRLGVNSAEAVTALRGILTTFLAPTQQTVEGLQQMGLAAEDFRASLAEKGLMESLRELVARAEETGVNIAEVIPNVRALAGVLGTAGAQGEAYAAVLDSIRGSTGLVNTEFAKLEETASFQLDRLKAGLEATGVSIGNVFLPAFTEGLKHLNEFVTVIRERVVPALQDAAAWFGQNLAPVLIEIANTVVNDVLPSLWELGKALVSVYTEVQETIGYVKTLGGVFKDLDLTGQQASFLGIKEGLEALNKELKFAAGALQLVALGFQLLGKTTDEQRPIFERMRQVIRDMNDDQTLLRNQTNQLADVWSTATADARVHAETVEQQRAAIRHLVTGELKQAPPAFRLATKAQEEAAAAAKKHAESEKEVAKRLKLHAPVVQEMVEAVQKYARSLQPLDDANEDLDRDVAKLTRNLGFLSSGFDAVKQRAADLSPLFERLGNNLEATAKKGLNLFNSLRGIGEQTAQEISDASQKASDALDPNMSVIWAARLGDGFHMAADFVNDFTGTAQTLLSAAGPWGIALSGALELAKAFGLDIQKALKGLADLLGFGGRSKSRAQINIEIGLEGVRGLEEEFRNIDKVARALGTSLADVLAEKIQLTTATIEDLIRQGLDPTDPAIRALIANLEELERQAQETANAHGQEVAETDRLTRARENLRKAEQALAAAQAYLEALRNEALATDLDLARAEDAVIEATRGVTDAQDEYNQALKEGQAEFQRITAEDIFAGINEQIERERRLAAALGEEFDEAGRRTELLEQALTDYILAGGESETIIKLLTDALRELNEEMRGTGELVPGSLAPWLGGGDGAAGPGGFLTPGGAMAPDAARSSFATMMQGIGEEIERQRQIAAALGETFDEGAVKASLLEKAIRDYISSGEANADVVRMLAQEYAALTGEQEDLVDQIRSELGDAMERVANLFALTGDAAESTEGKIRAYERAMRELEDAVASGALSADEARKQWEEWNAAIEELRESMETPPRPTPAPSGDGAPAGTGGGGGAVDVRVRLDRGDLNGLQVALAPPFNGWMLRMTENSDRLIAAVLISSDRLSGDLGTRLSAFERAVRDIFPRNSEYPGGAGGPPIEQDIEMHLDGNAVGRISHRRLVRNLRVTGVVP